MADENKSEWEQRRQELSEDAKRAIIALLEHVGPVASMQLTRDDGKTLVVTLSLVE